jgi:hypothetical protein
LIFYNVQSLPRSSPSFNSQVVHYKRKRDREKTEHKTENKEKIAAISEPSLLTHSPPRYNIQKMQFIPESDHERAMRRIKACTHTLYSVFEELSDPVEVEERADLLIAVENLSEIASYVIEAGRGIAWQYSKTPAELEDESDY